MDRAVVWAWCKTCGCRLLLAALGCEFARLLLGRQEPLRNLLLHRAVQWHCSVAPFMVVVVVGCRTLGSAWMVVTIGPSLRRHLRRGHSMLDLKLHPSWTATASFSHSEVRFQVMARRRMRSSLFTRSTTSSNGVRSSTPASSFPLASNLVLQRALRMAK